MISEIAPRGTPSMMASKAGMPVERNSRVLRSERNPSVVVRAALRFMQIRLFFAYVILHRLKGFVNMMHLKKRSQTPQLGSDLLNLKSTVGVVAID
jgi:hypothetical protein